MPYLIRKILITSVALKLVVVSIHGAACTVWTGPCGDNLFSNPCNWSAGVPGAGCEVEFGGCANAGCGATVTIDLCGGTMGCPHQTDEVDFLPCCNHTFRFINGYLEMTPAGTEWNTVNANVVFTCGGHLMTSGATGKDFRIAEGNNATGTLRIDGSGGGSSMQAGCLYVGHGNCSIGALFYDNGADSQIGRFEMNIGSGSTGTIVIDNCTDVVLASTMNMSQATNASSYFRVSNGSSFTLGDRATQSSSLCMSFETGSASTIIICGGSTISVGRDIDMGKDCRANTSFIDISGCSSMFIGQDIILGRKCGSATMLVDGPCTSICINGGLDVGQSDGAGHLHVSCGADITVQGCLTVGGAQATSYGSGCAADVVTVIIDNGSTVCVSKGTCCSCLQMNGGATLIVDGATHSGTATIQLDSCAVIRGDGCYGVGTVSNALCLNGGTFNDCTAVGDVLLLTGDIKQNGNNDDFFINGLGTIRLGADDQIDNSDTNLDIDLNGGTLDINGTNQGAAGSPIGNLTLSNGSTIAFTSGDATQDFYLSDFIITAGSVNINGWDGTPGVSGTGGRLIVDNLSNGWALGDNGGLGFDGIDWGGGITKTHILDAGGGRFELVPFGAVPEPSVWGAVATTAFMVLNYRRRRVRSSQ